MKRAGLFIEANQNIGTVQCKGRECKIYIKTVSRVLKVKYRSMRELQLGSVQLQVLARFLTFAKRNKFFSLEES